MFASYCRIIIALVLLGPGLCLAGEAEPDKGKEMSKEEILQMHQDMGIQFFNESWELLLKESRGKADEDILINLAHASLLHWRQLNQPINILRGEWMIAHVYTLLGHKESALYHARNTLEWAENIPAADWDLAYAYEAVARAQALNGNREEFRKYYELADKAGREIREEEDKKQFEADFHDNNWFGMK